MHGHARGLCKPAALLSAISAQPPTGAGQGGCIKGWLRDRACSITPRCRSPRWAPRKGRGRAGGRGIGTRLVTPGRGPCLHAHLGHRRPSSAAFERVYLEYRTCGSDRVKNSTTGIFSTMASP